MRLTVRALFMMLFAVFFATAQLPGQEAEHHERSNAAESATHDEEHSAESEEHGQDHGGHHYHTNDFGIFLGATDEHGYDTEFTWGLDYRRMIAKRWAIGGLFDYAGGELRNWIVAPTLTWLPVGRLQITAAPGIELHRGRGSSEGCNCPHTLKSDNGESHDEVDQDERYFVFRLGAGWHFPVGEQYGITPQVNLDLVEGERVWVYGLGFAYAW